MKFAYSNMIAFLLLLAIPSVLPGQWQNTACILAIKVSKTQIVSDSLTIIPYSVNISKGDLVLNDSLYIVNNNSISLTESAFLKFFDDTLTISYRTLRINLGKHYYHLDSIALKQSERAVYIGTYRELRRTASAAMFPSGLDYDGSFARGISLGNRQDVSMSSNFNLQMAGDIGGGLSLRAAISDANIPFQPEGTTQRLNEFDKVFIEIMKDGHSLVAGDFEISSPEGYFTRYFKKLKGLSYSGTTKISDRYSATSSLSAAISKGKFNRIDIRAINGNQGPYRLYGSSGDRYMIVLAGTERVFLDGRLLTRGHENDYIIDYNMSELIFTARNMITENSRIIVEFESSDQNYLRSLTAFNTTIGDSTRNVYFNFFNEQDSKTSLGLIELDSIDIDILRNAGSDQSKAFRSGIRPYKNTETETERVFYKKEFNPQIQDSILVFTNNPDSARYIASFTDFGENNGSYSIDNSLLTNGRAYKWVGNGNGRYEPLIQLIPPEKTQIMAIGSRFRISPGNDLRTEFSLSNIDLNRFSELDNSNNTGIAGLFEITSKKSLEIGEKKLELLNTGSYEFAGSNFKPLNPYRSVEFARDWNLRPSELEASNEHLLTNNFSVTYSNLKLQYVYSGFFRSDQFTGNKNDLNFSFSHRGLTATANGNLLKSRDPLFSTSFFRPKLSLIQKLGFIENTRIGFNYEGEKNTIRESLTGNMAATSFAYDNFRIFLNLRNSENFTIDFYTSYRIDFLPQNDEFKAYTGAREYGISGQINSSKVSDLQYNVGFRQLSVLNQISDSRKPESNLLGKINHNLRILNNGITSVSSVEFGSGQQSRPDFTYVKVARGEGTHIWSDTNNDGTEGKDEFFVIPGIDTANYIKIIQYNNEYIRANNASFNNNIRINLGKIIKDRDKRASRILSRLSLNSIFRKTEKTMTGEKGFSVPFFHSLPDTSVILDNHSLVSTLYYNLGDPNYDLNISYRHNKSHISQVGGFIINDLKEYNFYLRYNIVPSLNYYNRFSYGNKAYRSEFNTFNNYNFSFITSAHELQLFSDRSFNIKAEYAYTRKINDSESAEKALIHDLKLSGTIVRLKNTRIDNSVSYILIDYQGSGNNHIELSMLEGLRDGNNFLWNLRITRRMKNNLDLVLNYEGRKTSTSRALHTARMQARATF